MIIDFDNIETFAGKFDKNFEWYFGFSLLSYNHLDVHSKSKVFFMNSRPNGYVGIRESGDKRYHTNSVLFGNNKYGYDLNIRLILVGIGFNTQSSKDTVVIGLVSCR